MGVGRSREVLEGFRQEEKDCVQLQGLQSALKGAVQAATDHIILRKEEAIGAVGMIFLPAQTAQKSRPTRGRIVDIGPEVLLDYLKVGDAIVYHEYAEVVFNVNGIELVAVRKKDVICRLDT